MVRILAAFILIHSWYDPWCCSTKDCHPVDDADAPVEIQEGYKWHEFVFPKSMEKPSQDGHWHVCLVPDENGNPATPRCIYVPMGA